MTINPNANDVNHAGPLNAATPVEVQMPLSAETEIPNVVRMRPPDGGWGWVVVAASFWCNLVVDGIIYSFGMILPRMAIDLNQNKATVALVGSLLSGTYLIVGPFASALANRYGFRCVTIIGSIISCIAFVVSTYDPTILSLCITYGFLAGIGFGLIFIPSVISIGFYFENWRALATGIAVCGSGIGTFVLAPLSIVITDYFADWRAVLILHAGLLLSCTISGAAFRPLKQTVEIVTASHVVNDEKNLKINSYLFSNPPAVVVTNNLIINGGHQLSNEDKDLFLNGKLKMLAASKSRANTLDYKLSPTMTNTELLIERPKTTIDDYPKMTNDNQNGFNSFCKGIMMMFDTSLLRSVTFMLLALSGFTTSMGLYVPYVYINDRAVSNGMDQSLAIWLISVVGISNTVGRLGFGLLSSMVSKVSKPHQIISRLDALTLNNVSLTICGLCTIFSGISYSYLFQLTYAVLFGLTIACFSTLRPIIVVDLLGLDKLTNAFGLLLLFQGIAAIIGPPFAGFFIDRMGNYVWSFYVSGALILLSAFMCYPIARINQWEMHLNNENKS